MRNKGSEHIFVLFHDFMLLFLFVFVVLSFEGCVDACLEVVRTRGLLSGMFFFGFDVAVCGSFWGWML